MKSGVTICADNAQFVLDNLHQLSGTEVLVGIPSDSSQRDDAGPMSTAELGYLYSTGATVELDGAAVTLPPRPFLEMGIEDTQPLATECLKAAAQQTLSGNADAALRALEKAGKIARAGARAALMQGDGLTPLSERQQALWFSQQGAGDKSLYVHDRLLQSINYLVRKK